MSDGDKVTIEVDRDGCSKTGGYTVSINRTSEEGYGDGYRIAGPKFCSLGNNVHLTTHRVSERDAREIFGYIRPLLSDEWLRKQVDADRPSADSLAAKQAQDEFWASHPEVQS
jgi:hypothetical protein